MGKPAMRKTLFALVATTGLVVGFTKSLPDEETSGAGLRDRNVHAIVQADDVATARALALHSGATVTHELPIINSVGVAATRAQMAKIASLGRVRVYPDSPVKVSGTVSGNLQPTAYPTLIGANLLHTQGITGNNVTIAVLDTGAMIQVTGYNIARIKASYNAMTDKIESIATDPSGHGSHVASVAVSNMRDTTVSKTYNGVAPGAKVVTVKAFDANGRGSYGNVIRGIDWVVSHAAEHNIRVLNCSFSATPQSFYWDDPLNQAIMRAWQAGIVVVASAGNTGPGAMTVGVPGNVPYVITVGAMTDYYTPTGLKDDRVTSFSSAGPTYEGFVKPEVIAPGGHVLGIMSTSSAIAQQHPEFHAATGAAYPYFQMSGTSQAAAVVSGAAALILQANPALTPDQVKYRLMATARPFVTLTGALAYSVFQQGAGTIHAYNAVYSTSFNYANVGLNIDNDLSGADHYSGRARYNSQNGTYYLSDVDGSGFGWNSGYSWNNTYSSGQGYSWNSTWNQGFGWNSGFSWNSTFGWNSGFSWNSTFGWNSAFSWNSGFTGGNAAPQSINVWVNQQ